MERGGSICASLLLSILKFSKVCTVGNLQCFNLLALDLFVGIRRREEKKCLKNKTLTVKENEKKLYIKKKKLRERKKKKKEKKQNLFP